MRGDIARMEQYTPIVPFEVLSRRLGVPASQIIKLDANENPYGPHQRVYEALAHYRRYNIYPDPEQTLLREAVEPYIGLGREHIIFGNGSDELIDLTMRMFVMPGEAVVNLPPTFGMYSYNTTLCGGTVLNVPRQPGFSIDADQVKATIEASRAKVKMVVVNSPNNPDGSTVSPETLEELLRLPVILLLDEAYAEFAGESFVSWVPEHWNLVVLRTFSKWAGLGGLRLGYGIYPLEIAEHLWKIKPPYSINVAAQEAALVSLEARHDLMRNVRLIVQERQRLIGLLQEIPGIRPYPSRANFVLCRVHGVSSRVLKEGLARRGILVRYYDKAGLQDCIRISVGRPEQNDALVSELRELVSELASEKSS